MVDTQCFPFQLNTHSKQDEKLDRLHRHLEWSLQNERFLLQWAARFNKNLTLPVEMRSVKEISDLEILSKF